MRTKPWAVWAALAVAAAFQNVAAQEATSQQPSMQHRIEALEQELENLKRAIQQTKPSSTNDTQLETLDQKLRVLERKQELADEEAAAKARSAPVSTIGASGFSWRSGDSNFLFRMRGNVQADARFFIDDTGAVNDSFLMRRVRPSFEGTVYGNYDFRVMPDFAGNSTTLLDAYADLRFSPYFGVLAGKTKSPFGLERLVSQTSLPFVERGLPTSLAPNRDIGLQAHGSLWGQRLDYTFGILNGTPDGGSSVSDLDDDKEFAGRLFSHPFKGTSVTGLRGLGLGVAATYGDKTDSNPASYTTVNQQTFFRFNTGVLNDGAHWRLGPQAYWYVGPLGILGEYTISNQELRSGAVAQEIENTAWQVAVSYVLTGEDASYRGVTPAKNFNLSDGTWGAFEVALRYGELDIDNDAFPVFANPALSASKATSAGVGVNWYLNRNVKLVLNYNWTGFDGPVTTDIASKDEHAIFSRVQISF